MGAEAQALYMRLLYYANGARYKTAGGEWVFRKWFAVPSKTLLNDTGIHRSTMYKIRDELAQKGYIRFKAGIGRGTTEYMICAIASDAKPQSAAPCPQPKGTPTTPAQGSFDTDDFFAAAVRKSFGEDP